VATSFNCGPMAVGLRPFVVLRPLPGLHCRLQPEAGAAHSRCPVADGGAGPDRPQEDPVLPHARGQMLGARRSDPGVFGTIPPLPAVDTARLGGMFSTRSPGSPSASHSIPPSSRTVRSRPTGTLFGATGTGRTLGH